MLEKMLEKYYEQNPLRYFNVFLKIRFDKTSSTLQPSHAITP